MGTLYLSVTASHSASHYQISLYSINFFSEFKKNILRSIINRLYLLGGNAGAELEIFSGGRVEAKNTTSNNLYTAMGTCVYGFHPSTFASTIQIFNIFYIIFFQNLKRIFKEVIYIGGIY